MHDYSKLVLILNHDDAPTYYAHTEGEGLCEECPAGTGDQKVWWTVDYHDPEMEHPVFHDGFGGSYALCAAHMDEAVLIAYGYGPDDIRFDPTCLARWYVKD